MYQQQIETAALVSQPFTLLLIPFLLFSSNKNQKLLVRLRTDVSFQIRTTEDITTLIRQMTEAWKFGHLKTIDQSSDLQTRTDEDAKEVWGMLDELLGSNPADAPAATNGEVEMADGQRGEAQE